MSGPTLSCPLTHLPQLFDTLLLEYSGAYQEGFRLSAHFIHHKCLPSLPLPRMLVPMCIFPLLLGKQIG